MYDVNGAVIVDAKEEGERESDVALSHSSRATRLVLSFSPSFVVLFYFRFVVLLFCFVVLLLRFCRFADSVLSFCRIEA